jgi:hypothetical protein
LCEVANSDIVYSVSVAATGDGLCEVANSDIVYSVSVAATGMVCVRITQLQFYVQGEA